MSKPAPAPFYFRAPKPSTRVTAVAAALAGRVCYHAQTPSPARKVIVFGRLARTAREQSLVVVFATASRSLIRGNIKVKMPSSMDTHSHIYIKARASAVHHAKCRFLTAMLIVGDKDDKRGIAIPVFQHGPE